jgi:hypothetical protein
VESLSSVLVKTPCVVVDAGVVNKSYEGMVMDVDASRDDGGFSVVAVEGLPELGCVLLTDEPKEGDSNSRLLLYAVGLSCVDVTELSTVRSSDVVVGIDHGVETRLVERDIVLGSDCEAVNVELTLTKEASVSMPPFAFLAIATMAPTSAAVTNIAARQTAMKHRMV